MTALRRPVPTRLPPTGVRLPPPRLPRRARHHPSLRHALRRLARRRGPRRPARWKSLVVPDVAPRRACVGRDRFRVGRHWIGRPRRVGVVSRLFLLLPASSPKFFPSSLRFIEPCGSDSPLSSALHSLIALKLLIGINLRAYASSRWDRMEEHEQEDKLNDQGRPPIGVSSKERVRTDPPSVPPLLFPSNAD